MKRRRKFSRSTSGYYDRRLVALTRFVIDSPTEENWTALLEYVRNRLIIPVCSTARIPLSFITEDHVQEILLAVFLSVRKLIENPDLLGGLSDRDVARWVVRGAIWGLLRHHRVQTRRIEAASLEIERSQEEGYEIRLDYYPEMFLPHLSRQQRRLFRLLWEGYSKREASEVLGCSPQRVYQIYKEIIQKLREVVE